MLGSWEINHLGNPDLFHDLAIAYVDTSVLATEAMLDGCYPARFSHSRVVLSLAYHATELFLKGAILRKTGANRLAGHDVAALYRKYVVHFPDESFHFVIPFSYGYPVLGPDEATELPKTEPSQDQMYRYHTDWGGTPWEGVHGFDAKSFLGTLQRLRDTFTDLGSRIHVESAQRSLEPKESGTSGNIAGEDRPRDAGGRGRRTL